MKKTILIRDRFPHMGRHSGYDLLAVNFSGQSISIESVWPKFPPFRRIMERMMRSCCIRNQNVSQFYGIKNFWAEISARTKSLNKQNLVHILYAENNLGLFARPSFKRNVFLVITVHQPFSWWEASGMDIRGMFATTDKLIVLSSAEEQRFGEVLGEDRVEYVPHGIDTEFFSPPDEELFEAKVASPSKHYLFVGHWLRDFDALFAFIDLSTKQDRDVVFDLVVPDMSHRSAQVEERMKQIESLSCVTRHKGIDDVALRDLYRKATLLLMPLKDSTANNAVLEAMSCGLPIVTTATSGIHDYTDGSFARICPAGDVVSMHNATRQIAASRQRQAEMSAASRSHALKEFDWQIIGESVASIYQSLG